MSEQDVEDYDDDGDEVAERPTPADQLDLARYNTECLSVCLEQRVEYERLHAILMHAKFDGLRKAGFSENQAMDLVRYRGLN